jgi:hypothetical protein
MSLYIAMSAWLFCIPAVPTCQPEKPVDASSPLTLTDKQPLGRIQIPPSVRAAPQPYLEVPVSRISNPQEAGISIYVYLEWTRAGSSASEKIPLGNFAPFPANQPGVFMLSTSPAFEKLKQMGASLEQDRLVLLLELKRLNTNQPWAPLQITVAPVRWQSQP